MVAAFANNVKPIGEVMIGRIGVGEDYTDGLDAIAAADDSFFAFCVDTRVKARQKAALVVLPPPGLSLVWSRV